MRKPSPMLPNRLVLCLLLAATAACSDGEMEPTSTDKTESWAFNEPQTTYLGQATASIAADHGGESGFLLMDRGRDASQAKMDNRRPTPNSTKRVSRSPALRMNQPARS